MRAAHQAEAVAGALGRPAGQRRGLLPGRGQLQRARVRAHRRPAARAQGALTRHRLRRTGPRLPNGAAFERDRRLPDPRTGPRRTRGGPSDRPVYFPIVFAASPRTARARAARLRPRLRPASARPTCAAPATAASRRRRRPIQLLIGGSGINVYRPVYRDGAPTATVAQRRAALIGFAAGAFRVSDLAAAVDRDAVPAEVDVQLREDGRDGHGRCRASSTTPPAPRSTSPTAPGCWSSATPTGPTSACRC